MELVESVLAYDPAADENLINKAYVFAMKAHGSQKRASGDPYITHPLEVAGILTHYRMDPESIVTALLHDTIEDTKATRREIAGMFGEDIAGLVDGVTKLSQVELISDETQQAENFRKLLLAMSDDIRVLLVKLADRLHNMRTIGFLKPEKRQRIAQETMEIYAPLAERVGMHEIKEELQDLSFQVLEPEAYQTVTARLQQLRAQAGDLIVRMKAELSRRLEEAGIEAEVTGREKRPFSIWRKLEQKKIPFEKLADVFGFRAIVADPNTCYRALGAIHQAYPMVPGEFDDYISTPKRNNYQSLHTVVIGPERMRTEIQFRSREMHERAEFGLAAHWRYKEGPRAKSKPALEEERWLKELLDILNDASSFKEFLDNSKLNMYADQVFCFTPKGRLIQLPQGATPLDFAYAVHTDLGNTCVGAHVNGRRRPLQSILRNGDQVQILASDTQSPDPSWEGLVVTGKARAAIRRATRLKIRAEHISMGQRLLESTFSAARRRFRPKDMGAAVLSLGYASIEDLYAAVGEGIVAPRDVLAEAYPTESKSKRRRLKPKNPERDDALPIRGLRPGSAVHFPECCRAVPGDRIVGIMYEGRGIYIHTIDCAALEMVQDMPERWLDTAWTGVEEDGRLYVGRLEAEMPNRPGMLNRTTAVIANHDGNIVYLHMRKTTPDFAILTLDIEVRDVRHLNDIIAALSREPGIDRVERPRS
ncbi:MAG: RelA/SpoT family protein [Minwuia sp.]|uniref:RelA/SpoT family protein n=1 Tax=Minwuia sp. TaxID=2493630 RepID=UPI003A8707F7